MADKTRVELAEIRDALNALAKFNAMDLARVELVTGDGSQIDITKKHLRAWRFMGMSNTTFVEQEFWKCDPSEFF